MVGTEGKLTLPYREKLGKVYSFKASFCTLMSAETEIIFHHILWNERLFENVTFLAVLKQAPSISVHHLQKRQNFHNKAAVTAKTQIQKFKPMAFILCIRKTGSAAPERAMPALHPSVHHLVHISTSLYYAAQFLHLPSCRLVRWIILTKAYLHQQNIDPMHKGLLGVGTAPSKVSPGMAIGHSIYPRHPDPAGLIPTWGLSHQWCHSSEEGRHFVFLPLA